MDPREIERELREFLGKRFGGAVQLAGRRARSAPRSRAADGEGAGRAAGPRRGAAARVRPQARAARGLPRPVRRAPGRGQGGPGHQGLHALQPHQALPRAPGREPLRRGRPDQEQHPDARPDRRRQDLPRQAHRAQDRHPVRQGRRDEVLRDRLRRRRRRGPGARPGARGRRRHPAGRARHRLHRRDRQDRLRGLVATAPTSRAPACSARCSSRWRRPTSSCASPTTWSRRWRRSRTGGAPASARRRPSTRATSSSSSAARSPASTRSSSGGSRARRSASAPPRRRPPTRRRRGTCTSAAAEDLIAYGFESEFVGRLPVTVVLDPLSEEDLFAILRNPNCPVIQGKKADFKAYGIDVHFEDEALRKLAALAHRQRTGARGLASVVEATLLKFEKKLPSTEIRRLVVTPEMVDDPARELARLLADPADADLAARFERLAAAERAELARAFEAQAPALRERCRLAARARSSPTWPCAACRARGTDAEEACRAIGEAAGGARPLPRRVPREARHHPRVHPGGARAAHRARRRRRRGGRGAVREALRELPARPQPAARAHRARHLRRSRRRRSPTPRGTSTA